MEAEGLLRDQDCMRAGSTRRAKQPFEDLLFLKNPHNHRYSVLVFFSVRSEDWHMLSQLKL